MSIPRLLSRWRSEPTIATNVEDWHVIAARPAQFEPLPSDLHPALADAMQQQGIQALFSHQALAFKTIHSGAHIVIVTGTASGKTLCYNLPVLDRLLKEPEARALYLFPTKALAQDQSAGIQKLWEAMTSINTDEPENPSGNQAILDQNIGKLAPVSAAVYDGDTPSGSRSSIRSRSRLVISNPDMLHTGILPHHTAWAEFFRQLQFVVIDEIHTYRGVFGSHVANVIRRLKRIAAFYGAYPQFILTSATIGNPQELAGRLIEEEVAVIDHDGSAHGARNFLIYNPPVINRDLGLRRSATQECVRLVEDLLAFNIQTIIFGRSRRTVELVLTYLRQSAQISPPSFPGSSSFSTSEVPFRLKAPGSQNSVRGYRSGYLPRQRREIERGLRQGAVRAVVATTALELGIDIGGMGAALLVGYPGTIAATWQQAGRAGRGSEASLAIMVTTADPLDQFLAAHPNYFFDRSPEQALINPDNLLILLGHLRCAAFELPFQVGENFGRLPGEQLQEFLEFLQDQGILHRSGPKYFWMADQYPAQEISLRSASADNIVLQVGGSLEDVSPPTTIGHVDQASAYWMVHPQAVYLHEGETYVVDELDLEQKVAHLRRMETDYYTEPRSETTVQLLENFSTSEVAGGYKAYGEISVTTQVVGFRKIKWYSHEQLGLGELALPPTELLTTGYWLSLDEEVVERLRVQGLWRNDPNDYGPNWHAQRDRARSRDGYRCQVCGAPELERSHDVHHKVPFRTFLSYEQANQLSNLVTLCHACHHRVETAVRVRSGLAGLAFVLIHLAPLFLMCDTRDLGVHSDPQSPLADGRPAVVLYDQVPAGIGFSQRLYELHASLLSQAYELVSGCECSDGCPSCVGPGGESGEGGKRETLAILAAMIGT